MNPDPTTIPQPSLENAWRALAALKHHLEVRLDRGDKSVWLGEEARVVLRRFLKAKAQAPAVVERVEAMKQAAEEAKPVEGALTMKEELLRLTSETADVTAKPVEITEISALPAQERETRLAALRARAEVSPEARALQTLRETMVFAEGNSQADLVFVGEAPGEQEERLGRPFVGPAGDLLAKMIQAMGLQRSDVYISNICKFRPSLPNQKSANRKPTALEMKSCLPYVMEEMEIIQPKVIVALGATAAEGLLGMSAVAVSRVRLEDHIWRGIPVVVTYHPSYLLRNEALSEKRKCWEDLLKAMRLLGMPISDKQNGYFLPKSS
jgi:uracil-DNA glycosylase